MGKSEINKALKRKYGCFEDGRPKFRVVLSHEEFESRMGLFNDFTESGIFIRQIREVRRVPKYSYAGENCWVVEQLIKGDTSEIYTGKSLIIDYVYEPLWIFKVGLPLQLWACEFIVHAKLYGPDAATKKYHAELEAEQIDKKEVEDHENQLEDNQPYLATMLANKEAIVVPHKQFPGTEVK